MDARLVLEVVNALLNSEGFGLDEVQASRLQASVSAAVYRGIQRKHNRED